LPLSRGLQSASGTNGEVLIEIPNHVALPANIGLRASGEVDRVRPVEKFKRALQPVIAVCTAADDM
jgi:hypothetical protein